MCGIQLIVLNYMLSWMAQWLECSYDLYKIRNSLVRIYEQAKFYFLNFKY